MLFPNERLECFLEGHVRALEFLRGVPRRIVYDNLKAAVHRILHGRQRELNPSFQQLQAHYLFAADFANPAAGWEKGLVEGLVGYARRNFFVPVPEARSLDELNQHLRERLLAQREVVATGREGRTIGELWDEERRHFLALPPAPYRSCTSRPVVVSRQALVRHQKVAYSVPAALAGKTLRLDAFHDHIEVWDTGRQVAHHPLGTPDGPPILALEHYLDVLAHKPGGVRNARVVYALGEEVRAYRDAFLRAQPNGYRALVDILLLTRRYTTDAVLAGICQALAERIYDVAQVEQLIARALGQTPPDPERPVEALQGPEVAQRDLRDYDDLLAAGGAP